MLKNHKTPRVVIAFALLGLVAPALAEDVPADSGSLNVRVTNIQNAKGQIGCSLYASKEGFPSEPERAKAQMFVRQRNGVATCTFKDLKPGTYAVSVMHDENKDGELETSLVGRPKEWWGVSNDVPAERFGPPKYEKATFKYAGSAETIKIKLRL
jgi:uncharacterized protein (DUF2141 family)